MPVDRESGLQGLLDREAIRNVYTRYARGIDRADAALISSAYHPDAVEDHHGETYSGASIGDTLASHVLTGMKQTITHFTNLTITLAGDRAGCEAYYLGIHTVKGGEKHLLSSGRTFDRLERRGNDWRFISRTIVPETVGILPLDAITVPHSGSERSPGDPSYRVLRMEFG